MAGRIREVATPIQAGPMTMALLSRYVKARRTQSGLRIDDAALLCGVAKDTLMKIEHGRDTVQVASLLQVLHGLGIQLSVLSWEDNEDDLWR